MLSLEHDVFEDTQNKVMLTNQKTAFEQQKKKLKYGIFKHIIAISLLNKATQKWNYNSTDASQKKDHLEGSTQSK